MCVLCSSSSQVHPLFVVTRTQKGEKEWETSVVIIIVPQIAADVIKGDVRYSPRAKTLVRCDICEYFVSYTLDRYPRRRYFSRCTFFRPFPSYPPEIRYARLEKNKDGKLSRETLNGCLRKNGRHEIPKKTWTLWSILLDFDAHEGMPEHVFVRINEAKAKGNIHPAERALLDIQSEPLKYRKQAEKLAEFAELRER